MHMLSVIVVAIVNTWQQLVEFLLSWGEGLGRWASGEFLFLNKPDVLFQLD